MKALSVVLFVFMVLTASTGYAVDERAAKDLARESNCLKCHSVSKQKDGPPYKEIAAKYKDKADAVATLTEHITTTPIVKVDGKEEKHEAINTQDEGEIKNLIEWILSR